MGDEFTYNTPVISFQEEGIVEEDPDKLETYFDVNHENEFTATDEHIYSPSDFEVTRVAESRPRCLRKSLSMNNIPDVTEYLRYDMSSARLTENKGSARSLYTNNYGSSSSLYKETDKYLNKQRDKLKYVSMAESVSNFLQKTPTRFRSRPLNSAPILPKREAASSVTVPHSPQLSTKFRARSTQVASSKEIEDREVEEMKRHQFKANPLNMSIFQKPAELKLPIKKKVCTIVNPLNLTKDAHKTNSNPAIAGNFEFHAKAVPKNVLQQPKLPLKGTVKLKTTHTQPFSFERRNMAIQKRKEELINKVLEEEKKAREFHAKPPPKWIIARRRSNSLNSTSDKIISKLEVPLFKAKEPKVLKAKPFEPIKPQRYLEEINNFQLNTEKRAKEREMFEKRKKEKQESVAIIKKEREEEALLAEQEEINRIRKETVHRAQSIKYCKKFIIQPSDKELTNPKSPNFQTGKIKNKENII